MELPPERFDSSNAELFRFAKACGLATVSTAGWPGMLVRLFQMRTPGRLPGLQCQASPPASAAITSTCTFPCPHVVSPAHPPRSKPPLPPSCRQAKTPEARAAAVEAGLSRVVHTVDWAARHRFMTDRELRRWDRLVAWKAHDSSELKMF